MRGTLCTSPYLRSEEDTSELQSHSDIVCRLLLHLVDTEFYTHSLHDALPICTTQKAQCLLGFLLVQGCPTNRRLIARMDGVVFRCSCVLAMSVRVISALAEDERDTMHESISQIGGGHV